MGRFGECPGYGMVLQVESPWEASVRAVLEEEVAVLSRARRELPGLLRLHHPPASR